MDGPEMYRWFEEELKRKAPHVTGKLLFTLEATVTPGVSLAKITNTTAGGRPLVKSDVRPEGVRLHFPLAWQEELSDWLGVPPAEAYRLKSNWVHQPSIGVGSQDFEPYFKKLGEKIIELLGREVNKSS